MKIATFNVNSLRARLDIVTGWLAENGPDVLCVQETKVQDKDFPAEAIEAAGYNYAFRGQKSYNGVAVFTKGQIKESAFGLDDEPYDEARLMRVKVGKIWVVNSYVPQGFEVGTEKYEYKLEIMIHLPFWGIMESSRILKFTAGNSRIADEVVGIMQNCHAIQSCEI